MADKKVGWPPPASPFRTPPARMSWRIPILRTCYFAAALGVRAEASMTLPLDLWCVRLWATFFTPDGLATAVFVFFAAAGIEGWAVAS